MIVVVADDLTGAAEIAGIGLEYGLSVELNTEVNMQSDAALMVISADTRSLSKKEAVEKSITIAEKIKTLQPEFIYKKIDSVLRGHVLAEIETYMQQLQLATTLLLPGNPLLGRTIVDGHYFVKGVPVHETSFANDPEFAITSSDVLEILNAKEKSNLHLMNKDVEINGEGIFIGDIIVNDDLQIWSTKTNEQMLLVGAANFFKALLLTKNFVSVKDDAAYNFSVDKLYISGTTFEKSVSAIQRIKNNGGAVSYMPEAFLNKDGNSTALINSWSNEIIATIQSQGNCIVAFAENYSVGHTLLPRQMAAIMADIVYEVYQKNPVQEIIIEGGATAATIIRKLQLSAFKPLQQFAQGVIRMQCLQKPNLFITMKPGSYDWPHSIWNFEEISKDKRN